MSAHQQNDLSGSFYARLQDYAVRSLLIAIIFIISEIISTGVFDI